MFSHDCVINIHYLSITGRARFISRKRRNEGPKRWILVQSILPLGREDAFAHNAVALRKLNGIDFRRDTSDIGPLLVAVA